MDTDDTTRPSKPTTFTGQHQRTTQPGRDPTVPTLDGLGEVTLIEVSEGDGAGSTDPSVSPSGSSPNLSRPNPGSG